MRCLASCVILLLASNAYAGDRIPWTSMAIEPDQELQSRIDIVEGCLDKNEDGNACSGIILKSCMAKLRHEACSYQEKLVWEAIGQSVLDGLAKAQPKYKDLLAESQMIWQKYINTHCSYSSKSDTYQGEEPEIWMEQMGKASCLHMETQRRVIELRHRLETTPKSTN